MVTSRISNPRLGVRFPVGIGPSGQCLLDGGGGSNPSHGWVSIRGAGLYFSGRMPFLYIGDGGSILSRPITNLRNIA